MKKAWIFQGGWDGHEPKLTSVRFADMLTKNGYETQIFDTLDPLGDLEKLGYACPRQAAYEYAGCDR